MSLDRFRYWATAGLVEGDDPAEIATEIMRRWRDYREDAERCGQLRLWQRARRTYYGQDPSGGYATSHYTTVDGEQDERLTVRSNHWRSLARRLLIMATETRPAFEVTTVNDSPRAMNEASLAQLLIDYYLDSGQLEATARRTCEKALLDGRAYLHQWWDPHAGEGSPDPADPQREIRAGDVRFDAVPQYDVARDVAAPAELPLEWAVVRRWVNKWTLAARYPERARDIIACGIPPETGAALWGEPPRMSSDWVPMLVLYHEQSDALPQGRHVEVLGADLVLHDGPLTYERIPLIEITPTPLADTSWGYSDMWDLFALQEGYDASVSACVSSQRAAAHWNLLVSKSQQIDASDLAKGLRKLEFNPDGGPAPSWLEPPALPESALKLRDLMKDDMEINSGVNSVARGADSGQSGAQDALTQSMAVQYASGLIGSYATMLRESASHLIRLLQVFAKQPRVAEIAGANEMPAVRQFSGADLSSVRSVRVELAAPETRTVSGRDAMAKELVQLFPEHVSVEQYLTFKTTGRWQPMVQRAASEVRLIREENEFLATGEKPVLVLAEDNHALHIAEHNCVLHTTEARLDNEVAARVLEHIKEHRMMMAPAPMPGDPTAPGGAPPSPGGGGPEPMATAEPPMPEGGQQPGAGAMPRMPVNPATGAQPSPDGSVQMEGA